MGRRLRARRAGRSHASIAATRKELRTERKELEKRAGVALIDADWRLADFILDRGMARRHLKRAATKSAIFSASAPN